MASIHYLARIEIDHGAVARLGEEAAALGLERPLIVTDPGVAEAGHVARAQATFAAPQPVFAETPANPTEKAALAALAVYRGEDCDGLVALGGGSAIDLAKAVAILATHPGQLADYVVHAGGSEKIGEIAPIIAVPTTAGTGAEVGRAAVVTLASGRKSACISLRLVPRLVLLDPDLTLSLPPRLTAATGMDALSHGLEAYLSPLYNPPADAIALDVARRVAGFLPKAVADGGDRAARREMLMTATMGGLVLQKGLGAAHAAGHPLGAYGHHHGTLLSILLPPVLRRNAGIAPDRMAAVAEALGLRGGDEVGDWCESFAARLGLPTRLSQIGVTREEIAAAARLAPGEHLNKTNPRPFDQAEFEALLAEAF